MQIDPDMIARALTRGEADRFDMGISQYQQQETLREWYAQFQEEFDPFEAGQFVEFRCPSLSTFKVCRGVGLFLRYLHKPISVEDVVLRHGFPEEMMDLHSVALGEKIDCFVAFAIGRGDARQVVTFGVDSGQLRPYSK